MRQKKEILFFSLIFSIHILYAYLETPLLKPTIFVQWKNDNSSCQMLSSKYLYNPTLFTLFDAQEFIEHQLPQDKITHPSDITQSIDSTVLTMLIEELIIEVKQGKKQFSHFIILKKLNFSRKYQAGCLVLKFKDYPFVVKLFMENPKSFVSPFGKGWESYLHFVMGKGINRHLLGFTRIRNRKLTVKLIALNLYWRNRVCLPRKWYFIPKDTQWLKITGYLEPNKWLTTEIPSIYCIIADAVNIERNLSMLNAADCSQALSLCNYLHLILDPNTDNFAIEKETGKLAILDTEYFPAMLGISEQKAPFKNYITLYAYLTLKAIKDCLF